MFAQVLKRLIQKFFNLIRSHRGRMCLGLEYFESLKIDCNSDMTAGFRGTKCKYCEKKSITVNKYLNWSLYLLRA